MNSHTTIEKMKQMRLYAMADMYYRSLQEGLYSDYTLDQWLAMLVDHEWEDKQNRKIRNLMKLAGFKTHASAENIDYTASRNLDKTAFERLLSLEFIKRGQNVIITGPTGVGKSYLAQVIGCGACRMLYKTLYFNTTRLMESVKLAKMEGSYIKLLNRIKKVPLLILDDFGLQPFDNQSRQALMDIMEDRHGQGATIVAAQVPVDKWYELIGEGTIADAILDRLIHTAHKFELQGESMRKKMQTDS